ncbi:MAG: hypothetical protein EBZ49_06425 [Proteobacteria bacterium]|nr:hypothetical protein [Pseudomonadota bacterium]
MWKIEEVPIKYIQELLDGGYEVEVDSPDGFVPVNFFIDKGIWVEYVLTMNDGTVVRCNEDHLFETHAGWISAKDLSVQSTSQFLTRDGYKSGTVVCSGVQIPIVDINVNHANHRYYTEGVRNLSSCATALHPTLQMD